MNSYYSNRIEGQGTHPHHIEHALHQEFSDQPDIARLQRLALAHIDAERKLEARIIHGNGRSTHCALWDLSQGLWSPSRGLARSVTDYYAKLHHADMPRRGDLDGRGNLTTAGLNEWIDYFLDICLDQISFMHKMLERDGMKRRIEALVTFRTMEDNGLRKESILPLFHVFSAGPVSRGEFTQLTGLGARTARSLLSRLLAAGLLVSDTLLGPVRFRLPLNALQFLFPELYPEATTKHG